MTPNWIFSILLLGLIFHFAATVPEASSRKEKFLLSVLKFHNSRCSAPRSGREVEGVCEHRSECKFRRGVNLGACALFGVCCAVERTCSNASSLHVSYFVSPTNEQSFCTYRVDITNKDVCQIRIDFEEFSIAQPTQREPTEAFLCRNDSFVVTNPLTGVNFFQNICGENAGQHLYMPVNGSQGVRSVAMSFLLADRTLNPSLVTPKWRIKVSQIECTGMNNDYSSVHSTINTFHDQHWNRHLPVNDHLRLAPPGCHQYYPDRSGSYETFNYRNGMGPYIGLMNYAICFRRYPDVCGIRHIPVTFQLSFNGNSNEFTERDCDKTSGVMMPNQDYLYVPEGFTTDVIASKYCGFAINSTHFVTSVAPGPLGVFFRSDDIANPLISEIGFKINYQLLNSGC